MLTLLSVITIFALSMAGAFASDRPPSDDSEKSSVRLNTGWETHTGGLKECQTHAQAVLREQGYFVEVTGKSVFGLKEGMTVSVRCDHEGLAMFAIAYRRRPSAEVQNQALGQIAERFAALAVVKK